MRFAFIIAIMLLGITTAQGQQGQTVMQLNGQTNSGGSAVGSDPLGVPSSSLTSASSPSTTTGSTSSARETTGSASATSQSPLLLPGEIPDTSTQGASTTATAPGSPSPTCPLAVPATDGGSANLTEIAGASLGGC
jgi:hypothetical protein